MPRNDDAQRRTARGRSQTRTSRNGGSLSHASTDSYGRARQDSAHLSQSRYSRQTPQETGVSSRALESSSGRARRSSSSRSSSSSSSSRRSQSTGRTRSENGARSTRSSRDSGSTRASGGRARQDRQVDRRSSSRSNRQGNRSSNRQPARGQGASASSILDKLPSFAVPVGIAALGVIVLLVLVFAVLVPSCSGTSGNQQTSPESSSAAPQQGIVHSIAQRKAEAQTAVETANQIGSLETSNTKMQALVTLLGEEEAAKLVAQAKTNPDALWIAAHADAYAFDGIEVQYKILKLAADEPAAVPYVREFPAKYPMADAANDKDLAMDVASPSSAVQSTSIPHLYQWDRRWAYTIYSSATFGLTGCGPTSLAMVYQGLNRTVDRTPHDIAVMAEERGYMSEFNGTDSSFFLDAASDLGLSCWESYPDAANIREELSQGHVIIANLGPGFFTTNGHFFVLAGLASDGQVIVNDPYSVIRSSQTWDAEFIASESIAMFVYAKA